MTYKIAKTVFLIAAAVALVWYLQGLYATGILDNTATAHRRIDGLHNQNFDNMKYIIEALEERVADDGRAVDANIDESHTASIAILNQVARVLMDIDANNIARIEALEERVAKLEANTIIMSDWIMEWDEDCPYEGYTTIIMENEHGN